MADFERNERNIARIEKLRKMTGRTESLVLIENYLEATTVPEATKNREEIEKSDKMKKIFGIRPFTKRSSSKELERERNRAFSKAGENEQEQKQKQSQEIEDEEMEGREKTNSRLDEVKGRHRHSLESFDEKEIRRSLECKRKSYYSDSEEESLEIKRQKSQLRRLEKLRKLTGRSNSLVVIQDLIDAHDEAEAAGNARLLEKSDKMKKLFGQRPSKGILLAPVS